MSANPFVIQQQLKCAGPGCDQTHTAVNGWFVLNVKRDWFMSEPWYEGYKLSPSDKPVCGAACAQKVFEQYLTEAASK